MKNKIQKIKSSDIYDLAASYIEYFIEIDCKQDFRNALDKLIEDKGYQGQISVIRYKTWNKDYEKDLNELYIDDQMHLNETGYTVLDNVIAKEILLIEQNNQ